VYEFTISTSAVCNEITSSSSGLSVGAIVGIVIAVISFFAGLYVLVYYLRNVYRPSSNSAFSLFADSDSSSSFLNGAGGGFGKVSSKTQAFLELNDSAYQPPTSKGV